MRIVLTGGTGFIGRKLLPVLNHLGHQVLSVSRTPPDDSNFPSVSCLQGNLNDLAPIKEAIKEYQPEACFHLAWDGIPDYGSEASKRNLDTSIVWLDFIAAETQCRKIIVTGSCAEYGVSKGKCEEDQPPGAGSFLGWAKNSIRNYAELVCLKNNQELFWFRLFYVYGPGQRKTALIPSILSSLRKGTRPSIATPWNANDYIHVDDVAAGLASALEPEATGGVYNLGSGFSTPVQEIVDYMEYEVLQRGETDSRLGKTMKKSPGKKAGPPPQSKGGIDGKEKASVNFFAGLDRVQRSLGWKPKINLHEGLMGCIQEQVQFSKE